jgi:hypothetical protein
MLTEEQENRLVENVRSAVKALQQAAPEQRGEAKLRLLQALDELTQACGLEGAH